METPLPNESSKASLSPPVGGRLRSFRRDWLTNKCSQNVLNIIANGYVLPFRSKPNLIRFPLIVSEYKAQQKDQALVTCIQSLLSKNAIKRVENVKSLGFLVPKPHQRWRPVMETPESIRTSLIPGEWVSSIDLSDAYLHIPIHPNSRKYLRFCYKAQVFQFTSLPFGLATAPPGLYDDRKGSETNGPLKRTQNSPIPGRLADQVPVSGGSPSEHTGSGRPNSVLGVDNKSGKIRTETYSGVFVCGLRIPPRFSPCKTHSREMAQTSGFDPTTQVKTCFDCKMFDVSNWVASLNGENGPGGTPSHEALSVSHQWLRSAILFKAKLDQISSDSIRVQGPTKRPSLGHLYLVSPVKECHRKGGKCKISRVPSTQASPKVEASHRLKQAQHFSTRRKVQNGNSRVHQDLPDSRGVGVVDRSVGRLPAHPHPPKLKEIPKVLLQGSGVPIHLPPVRAGHSPPGLYDDRKGSETNGPLKRTQNSPIPGRLADQVPVSGGSPSEHTGSGRPNSVLGVDNKSGKIRTETYSGVFVRGLRIPPRFSPCKTHSREMAQTSGFDPTTQVKTCFDCKMFDVSNWVASLNGENGPGGTPSHEALSVSSQGALEISSVAGQPPSLDRSHCSPPKLVAKSLKCDERRRPSSQRPQYPTLTPQTKVGALT